MSVRVGRALKRRRKGVKWDYNGDGVYRTERMTTKERRYWTKWRRRNEKTKGVLPHVENLTNHPEYDTIEE